MALGDTQLAHTLIREDYIQHSPTVKTGRAGFLEFVQLLKELPQAANPTPPFFRTIAQNNMVAVHIGIEFMGQQKAVIDLFRIENGQLAEHWDASEDVPEKADNPLPMVEGTWAIENLHLTDQNAAIVNSFTQKVLIAGIDLWDSYVSPNLIEHHPMMTKGFSDLRSYYEKLEVSSLQQVIAEGNFVVTQAKGKLENQAYALYDVYRLQAKQIIEHWSVKQRIPSQMAHPNGMI